MNAYRKNLLEQLRLVVLREGTELTDEKLAKALTANENLSSLGFTLNAKGLIALAKSPDLDGFYSEFRSYIPEVEAKPMYPDFPRQVMNIDEAQFRFHQICHYRSTYGVEDLARMFGVEHTVRRGWLPEVEDTEKTEKDDKLLADKVLEVISEKQEYDLPLEKLLQKSERITAQEIEIVAEALKHVDVAALDLDIPFKQNMMYVFHALFNLDDRQQALAGMRNLCQHTGDVLKCIDYTLTRCNYRFRTSQKSLLVRLIESYPVYDWKANVILTNKKARRTVLVLQYLSYNRFSQSAEHKEVVRMLRNGELSSWQAQAIAMLGDESQSALDFIAERPGIMLRWTNWLLKQGYDKEEIRRHLLESADSLSAKTLVQTVTLLGRMDERDDAYEVLLSVLERKLELLDTPLKNKKVFVDYGRLDPAHSMLLAKNDEAGYVRNGLAYRIPEEVKIVRFFVYWNDKERVDIDLHATARTIDSEGVTVGWNSDFRSKGAVHSGDITHSNAAEYIDIDLSGPLNEVQFNVNLYAGKPDFSQIEKCFIGLLAVKKYHEKVKLYNPENCFFYNDIRTKTRTLHYGYVNVTERYLALDGNKTEMQWMDGVYTMDNHKVSKLTLDKYIELLLSAQNAEIVSAEEAEVQLVMEKPENDQQISLIDNEFFY